MFTAIGFTAAAFIAWLVARANENEKPGYDSTPSDLRHWILLLHARQDLKLISFLLFGILLMLGVIADRIH
jgi:hypothetical protein